MALDAYRFHFSGAFWPKGVGKKCPQIIFLKSITSMKLLSWESFQDGPSLCRSSPSTSPHSQGRCCSLPPRSLGIDYEQYLARLAQSDAGEWKTSEFCVSCISYAQQTFEHRWGTSPSPTYARVQGHFPVIFQTNHLHSVPVKTTIASSGAILVLDTVVETKAENCRRSVPSSEITE